MVSSRKESNVSKTVDELRGMEGGKVEGVVCHVGKDDHRKSLIKEVIVLLCCCCGGDGLCIFSVLLDISVLI